MNKHSSCVALNVQHLVKQNEWMCYFITFFLFVWFSWWQLSRMAGELWECVRVVVKCWQWRMKKKNPNELKFLKRWEIRFFTFWIFLRKHFFFIFVWCSKSGNSSELTLFKVLLYFRRWASIFSLFWLCVTLPKILF